LAISIMSATGGERKEKGELGTFTIKSSFITRERRGKIEKRGGGKRKGRKCLLNYNRII